VKILTVSQKLDATQLRVNRYKFMCTLFIFASFIYSTNRRLSRIELILIFLKEFFELSILSIICLIDILETCFQKDLKFSKMKKTQFNLPSCVFIFSFHNCLRLITNNCGEKALCFAVPNCESWRKCIMLCGS